MWGAVGWAMRELAPVCSVLPHPMSGRECPCPGPISSHLSSHLILTTPLKVDKGVPIFRVKSLRIRESMWYLPKVTQLSVQSLGRGVTLSWLMPWWLKTWAVLPDTVGSNPSSATYQLCDLGQGTLWALTFLGWVIIVPASQGWGEDQIHVVCGPGAEQ